MSKTYNDPSKQLARNKLREFILKQFPDLKVRQRLRIACFPGAEKEGEEAIEVKEVYDPLGILRNNVVGIERDHERAQRLRAANLGIEVVEEDASEYFLRDEVKPLDIIHLDYLGQQTIEETFTLEYIASRQWLNHSGIVATTYFGSREGDHMKKMFAARILNLGKIPDEVLQRDLSVEEVAQYELDRRKNLMSSLTLDDLRNAISCELINIFSSGTLNRPIGKHLFSSDPRRSEIVEKITAERTATLEQRLAAAKFLNGLSDEKNRIFESETHPIEQMYLRLRKSQIIKELCGVIPEESATALLNTYAHIASKGYSTNLIERYEYISNTGSPMLLDLVSFRPVPKRWEMAVKGLLKLDYKEKEIQLHINPLQMPLERFAHRLTEFTLDFYDLGVIVLPQRIHLNPEGNLSVQKKEIQNEARLQPALRDPLSIEKAEIYAWIRDGSVSDVELCQTYNITSRQLGCYKARVTMQDKKRRVRA